MTHLAVTAKRQLRVLPIFCAIVSTCCKVLIQH